MTDEILLAEQFETERPRLRGLATRMLGSDAAADDTVQEAWIRLVRTDHSGEEIANLPGWLTTVVSRICLDVLRSRTSRREDAWPDEVDVADAGPTPEQEAELVDAVGQAMTVVLDTLSPAERLAYVLKDVFAVPFEQIAPILGRSEVATRQLASRARRRLREPEPREDLAAADAAVVDAFMQALATTSSRRCSSCSTPRPRCAPTRQRWRWAATPGPSSAAGQSRSSSRAARAPRCPPRSTAARPRAGSTRARSRSSSGSPSSTAGSSRSRCWPTPPCSRVRPDAHLADSQRRVALEDLAQPLDLLVEVAGRDFDSRRSGSTVTAIC